MDQSIQISIVPKYAIYSLLSVVCLAASNITTGRQQQIFTFLGIVFFVYRSGLIMYPDNVIRFAVSERVYASILVLLFTGLCFYYPHNLQLCLPVLVISWLHYSLVMGSGDIDDIISILLVLGMGTVIFTRQRDICPIIGWVAIITSLSLK